MERFLDCSANSVAQLTATASIFFLFHYTVLCLYAAQLPFTMIGLVYSNSGTYFLMKLL